MIFGGRFTSSNFDFQVVADFFPFFFPSPIYGGGETALLLSPSTSNTQVLPFCIFVLLFLFTQLSVECFT